MPKVISYFLLVFVQTVHVVSQLHPDVIKPQNLMRGPTGLAPLASIRFSNSGHVNGGRGVYVHLSIYFSWILRIIGRRCLHALIAECCC